MQRITRTVCLFVTLGLWLSGVAPAQEQAAPMRHPVLIVQEQGVIPGSGGRRAAAVNGPQRIGSFGVAVIGSLSQGGEGFILESNPETGPFGLILSTDHGASRFISRRFGVGTRRLMPTPFPQPPTPFAAIGSLIAGGTALLSQNGIVQRFGDPAPGIPGATVTSVSRFQMVEDGALFWQANLSGGGGGAALYHSPYPGLGRFQIRLRTGDVLPEGTVTGLRNFRVSQSGVHHAHALFLNTAGSGNRLSIYLDGRIPVKLGDPVPHTTETWDDLLFVDVNNKGTLYFSGSTSASTSRDAVFALDGKIVMREGDVVDGIFIAPPAEANQVRLDDGGGALSLWTLGGIGGSYAIFYTPNTADFQNTQLVVREGTPLDFDGDGTPEATLRRFRFFSSSTPTMAMGKGGAYIAVELEYPGGMRVNAVIYQPYRSA